METPVLTDKDQFPTEEIIFSHIAKSKKQWLVLFEHIHTNHSDFNEEWRYYNDGKSWLLKVTHKSKTIFWTAVFKDAFKVTFYFGDKAEPEIMDSKISEELKEQFKTGRRYGKIRGITLAPAAENDIKDIALLIEIKLKIK